MISIKKIILLLLVFIQIFWWDNLLGQTKNVFGTTDCPQEKIQLHLSQQSLFPGEIVWFKIYCSSPLDPKEDLSNLAFIELISPENSSVLRKKILLKHGEGSGEFEIPKDFKTGIYYLLSYTNWMKNFGESSFYRKAILIVNPAQSLETSITGDLLSEKIDETLPVGSPLKITTDKINYRKRDSVVVSIHTDRSFGDQKFGGLSVSVYRKEPLMIQNPGENSPQGAVSNPQKIEYLPDYHGIRFGGSLSNVADGSISEGLIISSGPGQGTELNESLTDKNGNFNFLLKPEEGEKELVFTLPKSGLRLNAEESFSNGFREFPNDARLRLNSESMDYLKKKYLHFQFKTGFKKQNYLPVTKSINKKDSSLFYSMPYTQIKLKDFMKLDSLREYFYELVPNVKFVRRNGEIEVSIYDPVSYSNLKDKPALFFDGVLYNNFSAIAKIPVNEIDRFVVIPKEYYYKGFSFGGIIDIHSKKGDFNGVPILPTMERVIFPLANPAEWKFSSPDYSLKVAPDKTPDFRYLLNWEPNVVIDKTGNVKVKFYTSDVKGSFVVKVMGMTEKGEFIQAEQEIMVGE